MARRSIVTLEQARGAVRVLMSERTGARDRAELGDELERWILERDGDRLELEEGVQRLLLQAAQELGRIRRRSRARKGAPACEACAQRARDRADVGP